MYNVTITTTGIFDEIRPSLFPPIEGKEGITFMNALVYRVDPKSSFEEGDAITDNDPEFALERERIRAFVAALCEAYGKPYGELRDEFVEALSEFMLYGTYKGQALLSTGRNGYYQVFPMYKSNRGRRLLFQDGYAPNQITKYICDHMLRYFVITLFSNIGAFGSDAGVQHIATPLSLYGLHQALDDVDRAYLSELITVNSLDNTYSMDASNQSEFLLLADALGAYMVQAMDGYTESERLDSLSQDPFFRKICEPVHRFYMSLTGDAVLSVYDDSNHWSDCLLDHYIYDRYYRFAYDLEFWEEGDEGVLAYVRGRILLPLANDLINQLSQEKLHVDLYPTLDKTLEYLNFLIHYTSKAQEMLDAIEITMGSSNSMTEHKDESATTYEAEGTTLLANSTVGLSVYDQIYCLLEACSTAIRKYGAYGSLLPIVDALDTAIGEVDIESPDSWQAEYVQRVSRLSKWYRMLGHAFTGNDTYERLLQELITAQEESPFIHETYFNNYIRDLDGQDNVFNLECLQYLLLHHDIEKGDCESFEQHVQSIDHPYFKMPFERFGEIHGLVDLKSREDSNDIVYFLLLLKAIYRFYLDQLDQDLWQELLRLWSMYEKRKFQDYHAQWLCAKYMVALAVHMGDREQAELIKQDLAITFDEPLHRRNYSSAYQWSPLAFYTMAQIDEALGHLDLAQDNYDKAYVTHAYTQARWAYYKSKCASLWNVNQLSTAETKSAETVTKPIELERKPTTTVMKSTTSEIRTTVTEISLVVAEIKPDFEAVIQENKGKFFTMDEYKEYFNAHMIYLYR